MSTTIYSHTAPSHHRGWFWYEDASVPAESPSAAGMPDFARNPNAEMAALHRAEKTAFNRLFFDPTPEHIRAFMVLQDRVQRRAMEITARWQAVLLEYPELDYAQRHPTSSQGRAIDRLHTRRQEETALRRFAAHQGLFFFYQSQCAYCQAFAPIIKAFSEEYGLRVLPIAVGGGPFLPEFPDSERDRGQAARLHVTVYPSVYAAHPTRHTLVPLAHGWLSAEALRERVLTHIGRGASE